MAEQQYKVEVTDGTPRWMVANSKHVGKCFAHTEEDARTIAVALNQQERNQALEAVARAAELVIAGWQMADDELRIDAPLAKLDASLITLHALASQDTLKGQDNGKP
jgi:hypothetical protein